MLAFFQSMVDRMRFRFGDERGFTLAETLLATAILATAAVATMTALKSSARTTLASQRTNEQTRIALSALDDMRSREYSELGMGCPTPASAACTAGTDVSTANVVDNGSPAQVPTGETGRLTIKSGTHTATKLRVKILRNLCADACGYDEDLVEPYNGGTTNESGTNAGPVGSVSVTPQDVVVQGSVGPGTLFRVYRYVTWRDEPCTVGSCAGASTHDIKRVVVAVEPRTPDGGTYDPGDPDPSPRKTVWMSAFVPDPASSGPVSACPSGSCAAITGTLAPMQTFNLTDTACDASVSQPQHRTPPSRDHKLHMTSAFGSGGWANYKDQSVCKNTASPSGSFANNNACFPTTGTEANLKVCKPDLMWTDNVSMPACDNDENDCADTTGYQYATDLRVNGSQRGYGLNGIPIKRSTGCQSTVNPQTVPSMTETQPNMSMVHTWATNAFTSSMYQGGSQTGFLMSGRVNMHFYVGTYGANPTKGRGTICVTLIDKDESSGTSTPAADQTLMSFYCSIQSWRLGTNPRGSLSPTSDYRTGEPFQFKRSCGYTPVAGQTNGGNVTWPANGYNILNGHRLYFRLSVCGASCTLNGQTFLPSDNDLVLYYDYPDQVSGISVGTKPSWLIKPGV